ncbi:MAG: N-acetyltransferase [Firmicutes bacterium]|nr:N-acetyltransferase [Bacillota bacterium]
MDVPVIRRLNSDDAPVYTRLLTRAITDHPLEFGMFVQDLKGPEDLEQQSREFLAHTPHRCVLGVQGDEGLITGMVTLERVQLRSMYHKASVLTLYVTPDNRGQGRGRSLLEQLLVEAREMPGLEVLAVSVLASNTGALSLYRVVGFQVAYIETRALKVRSDYHDIAHLTRALP